MCFLHIQFATLQPFNTENPDKHTKSLAKNQVRAIFHMRDIRKRVLPKFIKLCVWRHHVGVPLRDTHMAAGSKQKPLLLSFPKLFNALCLVTLLVTLQEQPSLPPPCLVKMLTG